jgi:hypothetical protein
MDYIIGHMLSKFQAISIHLYLQESLLTHHQSIITPNVDFSPINDFKLIFVKNKILLELV